MKALIVAAGICLLSAGGARAATVQPLRALQDAAVAAVRAAAPAGARVVAKAVDLDPRLRLPACTGALQTQPPELQRDASRVSVVVGCADGANWQVRVAVRLQVFRKVLVTSHVLARGDFVGAGDVHVEERDVSRLGYGYLVDPAQLYGRRVRRPLGADTVITPGALAAREVVKRGEQVRVVARLDSIVVRAEGIALQSGDEGELVQVRSLSCHCVVQGRVSAPGVVAVVP